MEDQLEQELFQMDLGPAFLESNVEKVEGSFGFTYRPILTLPHKSDLSEFA